MSQQALTDATTLIWDLSTQPIAALTATVGVGNARNLLNSTISSGSNGENYQLTFIQDSVGGREIVFDSNFKVAGEFDLLPNKRTLVTLVVQDGEADVILTPILATILDHAALSNIGTKTHEELELTNVVHINKPSDWPTAVGGVIELAPTPGIELTYVIGATDTDIGSDRFKNTGGDIVIIGTHRTASGVTSTTSNTLFTSVDGFLALEFMGVTAPNAQIIDFTTPVATFKSFVTNNFIVRDCDTLGTIDGAFTTSLRTMTVIGATTGGLLWTGTDGSQINISRFLSLSGAGTLLDLGSATFDIINISNDNRFLSDSGSTVLSGLSNSGNLKAGGRAIVSDSLFNGLGTALSGIDTEDLQWKFDQSNTFADNSTKNTEVITDVFLTASRTVTVGGGNQGVYLAVAGTNWSTDINKRFTVSTAGIAEYIGLETIDIVASAGSTVSKSGGGADQICSKIAIDTGSGFVVSDKTIGCTENTTPTGILSSGLFEINTGDKIQLFVVNEGGTSDIIVANANMIITKR